MAPFIDGGRAIDRTNWSTTVISYYPYGGAIALALDLTLRDRSDGRLSLDDFMRAMWTTYGKPGGSREGYVDHPYTIADAEATLAAVSGDTAFARDFFARYIQGHEVADYARLLARAGFTMRKRNPGRAWLGDLRLESRDGWRVAALVPPTWPIYAAGIDEDDELQQVDGQRIAGAATSRTLMQRAQAGRHGADRLRRSHRRREDRAASRSPRIRTSRSCRSTPARSRRRRRRFAIAGWGRSRCRVPWLQLIDAALGVANFARGRKATAAATNRRSSSSRRPAAAAGSRPVSPASSSPR